MDRVIVACPSCKARFDVSAFKPGSKIRCGSCYKILKIPDRAGGAAPKKAPAKAPVKSAGKAPVRGGARAPISTRKGRRGAAGGKQPAQATAGAGVATPPDVPVKKPAKPKAAAAKPKAPAKAPPVRPVPPKAPPEPKTETLEVPPPKRGTLIGHRIGGEFELIRKIGEGGYGSVYEATDLTLRRRVAVKLMLAEKTTNKEFVEKFLREARTAAQLSHPNIVKIHYVGFDKEIGQHFLAMEFVEGRTLSDIMAQDGAFSVERAVDVVIQSCRGLGEAHRKSIIHRDIKPGNIMITPKGVVKVADFGLAKIYDPDAAASTVIGTPYFMPPEQFDGKVKDGRSDIYSLGVTMYYLLTLKRPFEGNTPARVLMNVLTKDPTPLREHNPDVPDGIWKVVQRMIARDVNDRYATCEELLRDLKGYQEAGDAEEKVFCTSCGFGNPFTSETCLECETSLLEPCPSCGTPDHVGAKFCGNCGANLASEKEVAGLLAEAEAHVAAGRYDQAIEVYQSARDTSPESSQVVEGLRRAEQTRDSREEALKSIRALLKDEKFVEAHDEALKAKESFTGFEAVEELLERAREGAKEGRLSAALEESETFQASGDLAEACAAARKALDIDPDSDQARKRLDEAEQARNAHADARERAARQEEDRELTEALGSWREALEVSPGDEAAAQAVERIEGVIAQIGKLRDRAGKALDARDLDLARRALQDAVGLLPQDPKTLDLIVRLREMEDSYRNGLSGALEQMAEGRFTQAGETLSDLAGEFPEDDRIREVLETSRSLGTIADALLRESGSLLDAERFVLGGAYVRAARRLVPGEDRVASLLERARAARKDEVSALAGVRKLLEKGDPEAALSKLDALGGAASPNAEVGALTTRAHEALVTVAREKREQTSQVIENSIHTARSLLGSGRPQAALAACQKVLRMDRQHAGARALKDEIDAELAAIEKPREDAPDASVETGSFDMSKLQES